MRSLAVNKYAMYNDQPPDGHSMNSYAHSKGMYIFYQLYNEIVYINYNALFKKKKGNNLMIILLQGISLWQQ